jgi:hypothetical protein
MKSLAISWEVLRRDISVYVDLDVSVVSWEVVMEV